MKIAFFVSEAMPYAKTGGLADVAGALPKFLSRRGAGVRLLMPFYGEVRKKNLPMIPVFEGRTLQWRGRAVRFSVWEHSTGDFPATFIDYDPYFGRDQLYGTSSGDYADNGERFAFFARASLETLKALGDQPDILHGHDWQSAMAFVYLKSLYVGDPFFEKTRSLLTIHNLAYQGLFGLDLLSAIGLPESESQIQAFELFGKANYLKAGLLSAAAINTVSPRYAQEIQTEEYGCGLDALLRSRAHVLYGILNGVDYTSWNPATDKYISVNYGPDDINGKENCKADLLKTFDLPHSDDIPVVGMVTRLAGQKGLDIVCDSLEEIFKHDVRLVILGTGERKIQDFLLSARKRYPTHLGVKIAFDEKIAHWIYAGSDMFLIPSRYEPCGLTQMYSLKYGTIPVVRATGGLEDTIEDFSENEQTGNGFKFEDASSSALLEALGRALSVYEKKGDWQKIVKNALAADFSWDRSADAYMTLYQKIRESA